MDVDKYLDKNRFTCNIYGTNGELLIGVGTPINSSIRKRLDERDWFTKNPCEYFYDNIALLDDDFIPLNDNVLNSQDIISRAKKIVEAVYNNPVVFSNLKRIENYDEYTLSHCTNVAFLAAAMGLKRGLSKRNLINLTISALTHDIGKCCIDIDILNKPGKLTPAEYEVVKQHSFLGYSIMCQFPDFDPDVSKSILHHHENYDGSGYPSGLTGRSIPESSSILHVCDVFDALVSERPYKKKMNEYDSINILKSNAGKQFTPEIVDTFVSSMQIYKVGSIVELEDGTKARISEIVKDDNDNLLGLRFEEVDMDISLDEDGVKLVKKRKKN